MAKKTKQEKIKDIEDVDKFLDKFNKKLEGLEPMYIDPRDVVQFQADHALAKQKSKELKLDFEVE